MTILLLLFSGVLFTCLGRLMFRDWYNHVTLYAGIWSITLVFFEMRLLPYYPLELETWLIIATGWLAFFLGSATVLVARNALQSEENRFHEIQKQRVTKTSLLEVRTTQIAILVVVAVAIIPTIQQGIILLKKFGSVSNVILMGNVVYSLRVYDKLPNGIPYLGPFALSGTFFAGVYTAMKGRLTPLAFLPLLIVVIIALQGMGRAELVIALLLFISGYSLYKIKPGTVIRTKGRKRKIVLSFVVVLALLIGGAEIVRSNRGTNESIPGATKSLQALKKGMIITPSIYLYMTIHYGVLNQYLKQGRENVLWGANTFAPIWRMVAKLGLVERVPEYQKAYRTPVGSNTATYLREIHADFGLLGVILYPYILGLLCSFFWIRVSTRQRLLDLGILAHLYVIVGYSFIVVASRLGYWLVSLIVCIIVGSVHIWLQDKSTKNEAA